MSSIFKHPIFLLHVRMTKEQESILHSSWRFMCSVTPPGMYILAVSLHESAGQVPVPFKKGDVVSYVQSSDC